MALLTDFGTRDPYVAAMKGVILSRCDAEIVDLSHELRPFDPFDAGWFLRSMKDTLDPTHGALERLVVIAVIDPGVGTDRRIVAAIDEGVFFIAPDNGLLPLALSARATCVSVENEALFLPRASTTFHGRDRFAPVAAAIVSGHAAMEDLGPPIAMADLVRTAYRPPSWSGGSATGSVVSIDHFGNVITDLAAARIDPNRPLTVKIGDHAISELRRTYGDPSDDAPYLVIGSRGTIEISMTRRSAADRLQCRPLDEVRLEATVPADPPNTED